MLLQGYLDDVNRYYGEHLTYEGDSDQNLVTSWNHMWWAANVLLAEATDQGTFHQATQVCSTMPAACPASSAVHFLCAALQTKPSHTQPPASWP